MCVSSHLGKSVGIYFQDTDSFDYKNLTTVDDGNITSVVPGDFDDDVQMDLLLTVSTTKDYQKQLAYRVYWGKTTHSVEDNFILVDNDTFTDQPLVFEYVFLTSHNSCFYAMSIL